MVVGDALFDKAPVLNSIKKEGLEAVIRIKDERRTIYKDAMGLFKNRDAEIEYEEVEIVEIKETKYKKESHKKDKIQNKMKIIKRPVTGKESGCWMYRNRTTRKSKTKSDNNRENNKKSVSMVRYI